VRLPILQVAWSKSRNRSSRLSMDECLPASVTMQMSSPLDSNSI